MQIIDIVPIKYNCQLCTKLDYCESTASLLLCCECYNTTYVNCTWCNDITSINTITRMYNLEHDYHDLICQKCWWNKIKCKYCDKVIARHNIKKHNKSKKCKKFHFQYYFVANTESDIDCNICLTDKAIYKYDCTCKFYTCENCAIDYLNKIENKCCPICKRI